MKHIALKYHVNGTQHIKRISTDNTSLTVLLTMLLDDLFIDKTFAKTMTAIGYLKNNVAYCFKNKRLPEKFVSLYHQTSVMDIPQNIQFYPLKTDELNHEQQTYEDGYALIAQAIKYQNATAVSLGFTQADENNGMIELYAECAIQLNVRQTQPQPLNEEPTLYDVEPILYHVVAGKAISDDVMDKINRLHHNRNLTLRVRANGQVVDTTLPVNFFKQKFTNLPTINQSNLFSDDKAAQLGLSKPPSIGLNFVNQYGISTGFDSYVFNYQKPYPQTAGRLALQIISSEPFSIENTEGEYDIAQIFGLGETVAITQTLNEQDKFQPPQPPPSQPPSPNEYDTLVDE